MNKSNNQQTTNSQEKEIADLLLAFLEDLHHRYLPLNKGTIEDYIPELAEANPDWFGISLVTADGQSYNVGDTDQKFTIQSISKPFVYGLALEEWGQEHVLDKTGVEPTGEPFNEVLEQDDIQARQYNPMVNAGAIATTSLISQTPHRQRHLLEHFRRFFGRDVKVDSALLTSRHKQDHLNRAIAYMMLNFGLIEGDIEVILDLYFKQCSLLVDCHDLAIMGATLANAGVNPITKERAMEKDYVKNLLSVMYTCGFYEFSGQWAYRVGLPAKSSLSGAIMAVVPNQLGIAIFSPPLGEHGKSVRGVEVFEEISQHLQLNIFDQGGRNHVNGKHQKIELDKLRAYFPPCQFGLESLQQTEKSPKLSPLDYLNTNPEELNKVLQELYQKYLPLEDGEVYVSEPDLGEVNPNSFAICVVTVDGQVYTAGDSEQSFLIQSLSKVFAYGMALEDCGRDQVLSKVDVEPTGDAYNSIIKVEEKSKRPYNPMVNTGAIAITSLIEGKGAAQKLKRVLAMYERYIGHPIYIDTPNFVSEQSKGDLNWAISYLLRNFEIISGEIEEILNLYLQQCSVLINCQDLAVMAATLANNGINPMTENQAINPEYIKDLLTVMSTCGLYDFAGEWAYKVGIPAKSGVGGGILAVVPGIMGIGVFSPPLDQRGNSVRGIEVCKDLSAHFGLHIFDPTKSPSDLNRTF